jgi:hypothetical protein
VGGVAVNDRREGWSHEWANKSLLVTNTSVSAQRPQEVSKESVLTLVCLHEETDSSDRGAACQAEFAPSCSAPNGARQWHKRASCRRIRASDDGSLQKQRHAPRHQPLSQAENKIWCRSSGLNLR